MIYRSVTLSIETIGLKMIQMSGKKPSSFELAHSLLCFGLELSSLQ